jgi:hypothetical protein
MGSPRSTGKSLVVSPGLGSPQESGVPRGVPSVNSEEYIEDTKTLKGRGVYNSYKSTPSPPGSFRTRGRYSSGELNVYPSDGDNNTRKKDVKYVPASGSLSKDDKGSYAKWNSSTKAQVLTIQSEGMADKDVDVPIQLPVKRKPGSLAPVSPTNFNSSRLMTPRSPKQK